MSKPEVIVLYSSGDDDASVSEDIQSKKRKLVRDQDDEESSPPHRRRIHPSSKLPEPERRPRRLLYLNEPNECVVTEGLMNFLRKVPSVRTCSPTDDDSSYPIFHIQQKDKWSCGFRNMQMILTSILPSLDIHHSFWQYSSTPETTSTSASLEIPSVLELQRRMEAAWKEDFDAEGARHYRNTIVGKAEWIGAVEVASLFSYMGVDATVVQFIRCSESRQQLLPFCISYFQRYHCTSASSLNTNQGFSSLKMVQTILKGISSSDISDARNLLDECKCKRCGHSVCVVGFEVDESNIVHLLAFDPMKSGSVLEKSLQNKETKPFRLNRTKLEQQDCQIVLCSTVALQEPERDRIKQCLQTATAAESAVLQAIKGAGK